MKDNVYSLSINKEVVNLVFLNSWYPDPLNKIKYFAFRVGTNKFDENKPQVVLGFTDLVLDMWGAVGGTPITDDILVGFCLQVIPYFLLSGTFKDVKGNTKVIFHRDDNVQKKEGLNYFKAEKSMGDTARILVFPSEVPTNSVIRRKILEVAYMQWQNDPHGMVTKDEFMKFIPITDVEYERNMKYLNEKGYMHGSLTTGGYLHSTITDMGIDIFENADEFNRLFSLKLEQQTVNIGGDFVSSVVVGNNNQIYLKSKIIDSFNELEIEIEKADPPIDEQTKLVVKELKNELSKEPPDPNKVKALLNQIKGMSIWLNQKILSHPVLSQVIASLIMKLTFG